MGNAMGNAIGNTMNNNSQAEMTRIEREMAAEVKRTLRMKQRQLIEAEEAAIEEQMKNKLREDIQKKEKIIQR